MKILKVLCIVCVVLAYAQSASLARGVIVSEDRTTISSEIGGNITYIIPAEGTSFAKGSLLAKVNCDVYEAQKKQVEVQKNIAKLQMEKNQELEKLKSIGRFEVLISKEEYYKQKAELEIVSLNVKKCSIYAPFDGKVVEKKVNVYQSVKPQQEILEIISTTNLEAKVVVPANWITKIKKGDPMVLSIDETNTQVGAIVKEIGAVIDPASQTILIRAKILKPNKNIIAGMSATTYFDFDSK